MNLAQNRNESTLTLAAVAVAVIVLIALILHALASAVSKSSVTAAETVNADLYRDALAVRLTKTPYFIPHAEVASYDLMTLKHIQQVHFQSIVENNRVRLCASTSAGAPCTLTVARL